MENIIGKIVYFTVSADGFNCYPASEYDTFASYYTSSRKGYFLDIEKLAQSTVYTYVRYGLQTKKERGRTGSLFGFSITFNGSYFNDLRYFLKIMDSLVKILIQEEKFLLKNSSNQIIVKPFKLSEISGYLDEKSLVIKDLIAKKYTFFFESLEEINDPQKVPYRVHPESSQDIIIEKFRKYGALELSPEFEVKLFPQVKEKFLENENFPDKLAGKEREISYLNNILFEKKEEKDELVREINDLRLQLEQSENETIKFHKQSEDIDKIENNEKRKEKSVKDKLIPKAIYNIDKKWRFSLKELKPSNIAVVLLYISLLLAIFWVVQKVSKSSSSVTGGAISDNFSYDLGKTTQTDDGIIAFIFDNNKNKKGFLAPGKFLTDNNNENVETPDRLKEIMTSFLMQNTEVSKIYNNNKDALWSFIKDGNPNSIPKLEKKIEEGSFTIKRQDKELFEKIIVYHIDNNGEIVSQNINENPKKVSGPNATSTQETPIVVQKNTGNSTGTKKTTSAAVTKKTDINPATVTDTKKADTNPAIVTDTKKIPTDINTNPKK